ncbi:MULTISPECIES: hypothetical protein [Streptomyces]|uniref:Uncharacterized protein n=2 Tax=Streptomyces TaxID=1883 RepID=A0ABV9IL85_9ACTN
MTTQGAERTRRTAVPVRAGESAGSLKALLPTLQRTVGNKAVVGLLTAQRTTVQPQVQRAPGMPLEEANQDRMPPGDRRALETAVAGYIPLAFTAFSNATTAHAAAIKNEAKAKAEMIAMVVDVATGFLAPVFANYVISQLAAKAASAPVQEVTKKAITRLISQQDTLKASFTGATKIANQLMKNSSNTLFGESEIDAFALGLRNSFQRGAGSLLNQVTTMPDPQLIALWTAYDPDNADESAYRNSLGELFARYQKQVEPIGERLTVGGEMGVGNSASTDLYEVQLASRKRLATLTSWTMGGVNLDAWITPDMESVARAKAKALGRPPTTIALRDVHIPLAEVLDPPRPDLRNKDMLDIVRSMPAAERRRAGANPDVITVVETGREIDGRVPNQNERHQILFLLGDYSEHAVACLKEMDSFFPSYSIVERHLTAAGPGERSRLAQDAWFMEKLRNEFSGYALAKLLFILGVGPKPEEPADIPYYPGL